MYDLIVVGMGPSSIFLAYELIKLGKHKNILLIDQGKSVEKRCCPINKTKKCYTNLNRIIRGGILW